MTREMHRELKRQAMLRDNDHSLAKVASILSYALDRVAPEEWDCFVGTRFDPFAALEMAEEELIARRRVLTSAEESF